MESVFWLPAATQREVKFDECQRLICLCRSELIACGQKSLFALQQAQKIDQP